MNPPFSVLANVEGRIADAAYRHLASALARLADGGRLVAITGANFGPDMPAWRDAFVRLQERGRVVFTAAVHGSVYAKHGTTVETRLTVIDKIPADDPLSFPASPGTAPDIATLMTWIAEHVPPRLALAPAVQVMPISAAPRTVRGYLARTAATSSTRASLADPQGAPLAYETVDWTRPRARGSAMRSTSNTDCRRSAFPALRPIPPSSCSPPPWLRSLRRSRAIGRRFLRPS